MSQRSRLSRLGVFFSAMFPPWVIVPAGIMQYLVLFYGLQALAGVSPMKTGIAALCGGVASVLFALQMRVYDELKDVETDQRLGGAGDPRFADRPIVTGAILEEDLVLVRWVTSIALFLVVIPVGTPAVWGTFLLAFFLMWLSFKWFFWPAIQKNIVLAFVTHNPLTVFVLVFGAAIAFTSFDADPFTVPNAALIVGMWFPVAAWELSRKVRVPEDETDYDTYSRRLGAPLAAFLPAAFTAGTGVALTYVAFAAGLPSWIAAAIAGLTLLPVGACLLFMVRPSSSLAERLRPLVELHASVANVLLLGGFLVQQGVTWS